VIEEGLLSVSLFGHEAIGTEEVGIRHDLQHTAAGAPSVYVLCG
jgi:hypothetical protein